MSDFNPPKTVSDIVLQDQVVDNMLWADDIVELTQVDRRSPDLANLQLKADYTYSKWCRDNFLELSILKTKAMIVGATTLPEGRLTVGGGQETIEVVDHFQYGGIVFSSDPRKLFDQHLEARLAQARNAIHSIFATESFVGSLSVPDGIRLYYARVDPYLMFGSEVILGLTKKQMKRIEAVQISYFRRLMRLNPRTWVGDLEKALARLDRYPVAFDVSQLETVDGIDNLIEEVDKSSARFIYDEINSSRFPFLSNPARRLNPGRLQSVSRLRKYLRTVIIPAHRCALTQLLCANHPFAVERMRRVRRREDNSYISRECRPCRYCGARTESEIHTLFECVGLEDLIERRNMFLARVDDFSGTRTAQRCLEEPMAAVHYFLEHDALAPAFGKFVFDVFTMFPLSSLG